MGVDFNSYLEVNLNTLCQNYERIQKWVGPDVGVIPVLKGNAYGMGLESVAGALVRKANVKMLACAHLSEALRLREYGLKETEILVLGGMPLDMMTPAVFNDIQMNLFNNTDAYIIDRMAELASKVAKVHIKIETGLNRIGVRPGEPLEKLLDYLRGCKHIQVVGAYTQYACADERVDEPFTKEQFALYQQAVKQIEARGIELQYKDTCNSGGIVWFKEGYLTHVRPGRLLYLGQYPNLDVGEYDLGVEECFTWNTSVVNVHDIAKGESVGYDRHFVADKPMTVATIGVGYGDGLYRPLANGFGPVLINDQKTRYLGLCMDQAFVDVTGMSCKLGDPVTIFGRSRGGVHLSPITLGEWVNQPACALMSLLTERVGRVYLG